MFADVMPEITKGFQRLPGVFFQEKRPHAKIPEITEVSITFTDGW